MYVRTDKDIYAIYCIIVKHTICSLYLTCILLCSSESTTDWLTTIFISSLATISAVFYVKIMYIRMYVCTYVEARNIDT